MKRVALITYQSFTRGQGGGTRYAATVARWAHAAGYAVTIVARSPDRDDHHTTAEGIAITELGGQKMKGLPSARLWDKDFVFARAVRRYLERQGDRFDIVHSIISDITTFIPRRLRSRLVVSVIEDFWTKKVSLPHQLFSFYQRFQAGIAVRDSAVVTVPSQTALSFFKRSYPRTLDKYRVIYDFVDAKLFKLAEQLSAPPPRRPAIFVPQRAVSQKMVDTAIRAASELRREYPELRVRIAGGGPHEQKLKRLAQRLGLAGQISFLGSIPFAQMPNFCHTATVVVVTSASEGAQPSPTAAEALACGRPLVMTDVCDTDRVFVNLVPQYRPGDHHGLAHKLRRVLRHYDEAFEHTRRARAIILERFSLEKFLRQIEEIYRSIS